MGAGAAQRHDSSFRKQNLLAAGNFAAVVAWLSAHDYRGWLVVEQDVLPGMGTPRASAQRNREYLRAIGL